MVFAIFHRCIEIAFFRPEGRMAGGRASLGNYLDQRLVDRLHAGELDAGGDLVDGTLLELEQWRVGRRFMQPIQIQLSFRRLEKASGSLFAHTMGDKGPCL
ncbi:MAG: hypothetical protein A2W72_08580 [Burkholderiales bacterium RIFCSPLOWO2_12_67_14]|nr:MAG: hypothetical protein A2W72_08580 [Burkholderiales bacterium RIFCSPLOWO2_12_67_14]